MSKGESGFLGRRHRSEAGRPEAWDESEPGPGTVVLRNAFRRAGETEEPRWLVFRNPRRVYTARRPEEVPKVLEVVYRATRDGSFAAGFLGYEAASGFDAACRTRPPSSLPCAWFGIFSEPLGLENLSPVTSRKFSFDRWEACLGWDEYLRRVQRIRDWIAAGEVYQVNLTFFLKSGFSGSPWAAFQGLVAAQQNSLASFLRTEGHALLSASPELFFRQRGDRVVTSPMKGTAARGRWLGEDQKREERLRSSPKERAENLMIVDLLRNDLGRLAERGSVRVSELFETERHETIIQMVSTIEANIREHPCRPLQTLFPCGSVTGAPKIAAMEKIALLEREPRGVYTGSTGWIGPDGRAAFNVAIRTIELDLSTGRARYGVGSGVTWDSDPAFEFQECRTKAEVLFVERTSFDLLETILWDAGAGFFLLEEHLARVLESAVYFSRPLKVERVRQILQDEARRFPRERLKVRVLVDKTGRVRVDWKPLPRGRPSAPLRVALADEPVDSRNPFLFHKTTRRKIYEEALAGKSYLGEVLLWNERGEVTEGTTSNLVFEIGGSLWTPARSSGLLAGTFRRRLLEEGRIRERVLKVEELARVRRFWLINSVRGWRQARWADERVKRRGFDQAPSSESSLADNETITN